MNDNPTGCDTTNYTQVPNSFFDRLLGEINSMSEMKVTLCLIRKIYGWHKENDPEGDLVSFSQFIEVTKLSRPMVKQGLDAGVKRGSILRVECGQSFLYRLNLTDYQGEAPESMRGSRLAEAREVKRLNRSIEQTSLDNRPDSGLENKPTTGLDNRHTKERELNKDLNKRSIPPPEPAKPENKREPGELPRRPVNSESDRIAEYFAHLINSDKDSLSRGDYMAINKIVAEGFTLDRARPGIDSTVGGIRGRGEVVSSFQVCFKAIRQLDPDSHPVSFQDFRERPKPVDPNAADRRAWAIRQAAEMGLTLASVTA